MVDVRECGAVGDGIVDDTDELLKAVDVTFGRKHDGGIGTGILEFSPGVYNYSRPLHIDRASGAVRGHGVSTSPRYNGGKGSVLRWIGSGEEPMVKVTDSRHLTFENLRFVGNDESPPTYAIEFNNPGGASSGSNEFLMVRDVVIGQWPWNADGGGDTIQNGIGFTGENGNNDQMFVERVQISVESRGIYLPNSQSVWGRFTDVFLLGCAVGIEANARTVLTNPMFHGNALDLMAGYAPIVAFNWNSEQCGMMARIVNYGSLVVYGGKTQTQSLTDGVLIDALPSGEQRLRLHDFNITDLASPESARIVFGPVKGTGGVGTFHIEIDDCDGFLPEQLDFQGAMWAAAPESSGTVEFYARTKGKPYRFRNELRGNQNPGRGTLDVTAYDSPFAEGFTL